MLETQEKCLNDDILNLACTTTLLVELISSELTDSEDIDRCQKLYEILERCAKYIHLGRPMKIEYCNTELASDLAYLETEAYNYLPAVAILIG